jgi:cell division protease FtsH
MITYALGGRAAEKLVFNQFTTGAGNDIERATELARKMVCEWGMSDKLGPLAYGAKEEELFLGREVTKTRSFSEDTAIAIDAEVRLIVTRAMKRADKILKDNVKILHRLANALLEREILDSEEIDKIIRGEELPPVEKHVNGTPSATTVLPETSSSRPKTSEPAQPVISEEKKL